MAGEGIIYKGDDAYLFISSQAHSVFAISDFTLTMSKDTAEQELVGEQGSFFLAGSFGADGSFTACKLTSTGVAPLVGCMLDGYTIKVSGNCGTNGLKFFFKSCQITGFDFSLAGASDITEGTIDFTLLYPYAVTGVRQSDRGGTYITDFPDTY